MRCKVESAGVGVGNQGLGQVWSPRCPRRIDAGEREEDEAAQDHRDDSADDHDESLVNAENNPICMSARLDLKVTDQVDLFAHRLLSGPTAQKHATVISPPAAKRIPM